MAGPREVDLVLFEAGGRRWAVDAWAVCRVGRRREVAREVILAVTTGERSLVVETEDGEVEIPIDRLLGFERVAAASLRPVPAFARSLVPGAIAGAWLSPGEIVLLIDLHTLVKEDGAVRAPAATSPAPA